MKIEKYLTDPDSWYISEEVEAFIKWLDFKENCFTFCSRKVLPRALEIGYKVFQKVTKDHFIVYKSKEEA